MKYFCILFSLKTGQLHDIVRVLRSNFTPLLPSDKELSGLELNGSSFYDLLRTFMEKPFLELQRILEKKNPSNLEIVYR